MRVIGRFLLITSLALLVLGCEQRTDRTDSGGVLLEVEFVQTAVLVSVNSNSTFNIPEMEVRSIVADPTGTSSSLMDVELDGYEVTYARTDGGTRVPTPFVQNLVSRVPVGGVLTLSNFPVMGVDQLRNVPLSDLLFVNGGFDKETGQTKVQLNLTIRFFGRTLTGTRVESVPRSQTTDFIP